VKALRHGPLQMVALGPRRPMHRDCVRPSIRPV
jgi:hypothetical protein